MTEDGNRHGSTVEVDPHYLVRWDDDPTSLVGGTHIKRLGPEVGDLFTGDDGPFIASLPDGTVVVNEDGNALLRCDGRWVDGWFGTWSSHYLRETFAVLHIPKEVV